MEGHPAAGLVAGHARSIGGLALLTLLFTDVACLRHRDGGKRHSEGGGGGGGGGEHRDGGG